MQHQREEGAALHIVTHEARGGRVEDALEEIAGLPETQARAHRAARHLTTRRHGNGLDVIPLVERYRDRLPIAPGDPFVSLCEGSTPLVRAHALSAELGVDIWLKWRA